MSAPVRSVKTEDTTGYFPGFALRAGGKNYVPGPECAVGTVCGDHMKTLYILYKKTW